NTLAFANRENGRSGSWINGAVDVARIGLAGHSVGGAAVIYAANNLLGQSSSNPGCGEAVGVGNVRSSALAVLAPGYDHTETGPVNGPVLIIFGSNDTGEVSDLPLTTYGVASGPKHLVAIAGGNHYGYTDNICVATPFDGVCDVGGVAGPEAQRRQQLTARNY